MKTTNVKPFHCEVGHTHEGFTLTFFDRTAGGMDLRYVIHFEFWWVKFLARDLWKVIQQRQASVDAAKAVMEKP